MADVIAYTTMPVISTRGRSRWDRQQSVGALVVRPDVRLEVSRCWLSGEQYAQFRLWQQRESDAAGGWQPAGPEFALPVAVMEDVVQLLQVVAYGSDGGQGDAQSDAPTGK